jgi:hypothetical protein
LKGQTNANLSTSCMDYVLLAAPRGHVGSVPGAQ